MTKLLEKAIEAVRKLPPERQDELAESLVMAANDSRQKYTSEQINAMHEGLGQANSGHFASEKEIASLFAKYRNV